MGLDINGVNNVPNVNIVSSANTVENEKLLNCVFGEKRIIPNTPFSREEQHTLGILANHQDCILIED